MTTRRQFISSVLFAIPGISLGAPLAQLSPTEIRFSREDMEKFLRTAKIERTRTLSQGITNSQRATLTDGCLRHDAHIQTIDDHKLVFRSMSGTYLNFSDTYKHNIAAYLLDKMLDLRMVPVSVERKVRGRTAALTWWVDNVLMSEKERYQDKITPPDNDRWNRQIYCVRVFDELIYNIDRNLGNLLITKGWDVWMIDHTRAFRPDRDLRNVKNLERCDRQLLSALQRLTYDSLKAELGSYLNKMQLEALIIRRDRIVEFFEKAVAEKGEMAVLYDYLPRPAEVALAVDTGANERQPCQIGKLAGRAQMAQAARSRPQALL